MAVDDDPFSSPPDSFSSRRRHGGVSSNSATTVSGGEIERIRQALIEDRLAQIQEAEIRRPDYLKRTKRQLSEVESGILADHADQDRGNAVGIMESPNQGRRLKLFQETSEESFEESLMAGGYGRYVSIQNGLFISLLFNVRVAEDKRLGSPTSASFVSRVK